MLQEIAFPRGKKQSDTLLGEPPARRVWGLVKRKVPIYPSELLINMTIAFRIVLAVFITCATCLSAAAFDINKDVFVSGDLHAAWKADPLADPPKMFESVPPTAQKGDHRLARAGKQKGGVSAFGYGDAGDAANAYDIILEGMGGDMEVVENLGDQARSFSSVTKHPAAVKLPDSHRAGIVFLRGNTVIYIGLADIKADELIPYAKKLDSRIQK
jgi:hypothetical protein